jgi:c-di-GMP phosphodiesterase
MDADLMDVLGELVTVGFTLALDNFSYRPELEPLLRLAKIGKLNVQALSAEELAQHVKRLREWDLQIIAEKVETREQLDYCRQLGIDGFQGYFFARPAVMAERPAPTFRLDALAELLDAGDDDFEALEKMISHDAGLCHKLLRLANSAHVAPRSRIRSIRHALTLLGVRTVRRWTMLLMLAGRHGQPHELLVTALVRARLCETLAEADPAAESDRGFTAGLFSIADALLHSPLPQLLAGLPFDDRLTGALLDHEGPEGRILHAVLAYERGHFPAVAEEHDLAAFGRAYYDAVSWATEMVVAIS